MAEMNDSEEEYDEEVAAAGSGKVVRVSKKWAVREDGALAWKMQNDEFCDHFGKNRNERSTMRTDLVEAKTLQTEEEMEVTRKMIEKHEALLKIEHEDELLAKELQDKVANESKPTDCQEQDCELARRLQEKEERRYQRYLQKKKERELSKERQRLEEEASGIFNKSSEHSSLFEDVDRGLQRISMSSGQLVAAAAAADSEDSNSLTQQQTGRQLHPDERLALILQEQERKRCSKKAASMEEVEEKDFELAKIIQEQEILRARRRKEKRMREKQLQNEEAPGGAVAGAVAAGSPYKREPCPLHGGGGEDSELAIGGRPAAGSRHSSQLASNDQQNKELRVSLPSNQRDLTAAAAGKASTNVEACLNTPSGEVPNIALQIDPTYASRQQQQLVSSSSKRKVPANNTATDKNNTGALEPEMSGVACSVVPIQGQRRTASMEKKKNRST